MKAVILNSGIGSRMGDATKDKPKCLVLLNEEDTILSRQIRMLLKAGIKDFLITIGPYGDMIPDYVRDRFPDLQVAYVRNEIYDKTNYIYSMFLADSLLREEILLFHGDIVLEENVLNQIIQNSVSDSVIVDTTVPLPDKDFKARVAGGHIKEIGINIPHDDGVVFLLPVYKLSKDFMQKWMDEIGKFVDLEDTSVYAENAFNTISGNFELTGLDIKGGFCMEVDTLEDLNRAKELVK